ncbi:MFS transporter [Vibrio sp. HN007]|uniref:MFS transporter n=1 Tax=Vibrio iocasae TaxID=3098914 RepID=UPI0035D4AAC9
MDNTTDIAASTGYKVPIFALSLYAVASGYLMSLIPLMLSDYAIDFNQASWLASSYFAGLLIGALIVEPFIKQLGHRNALVTCLLLFMITIIVLPIAPSAQVWLAARFTAGIVVAGVYVIIESWLLVGDESNRVKRFGLYLGFLNGGSALGQLGIGFIGVHGGTPFAVILSVLGAAILVMFLVPTQQPPSTTSTSFSFKQASKLNHAAIIGCIVSGLTLSAIYGLMPMELLNREISQSSLSTLMATIILGGMVIQTIIPRLVRNLGHTLSMGLLCLVGVFALGLVVLSNNLSVLTVSSFLIGMAAFSLYPIAINLGCNKLDESQIISVTQMMMFCYSIGSIAGPMIASQFMTNAQGLMAYLLAILMSTAIFMLIISIRAKNHLATGK